MANNLAILTDGLFKKNKDRYQIFAEESALFLSNLLSQQTGQSLKFNGYARGPNIFIETADAATTRWAAINNPLLGEGYATIRRSCYGTYDSEKENYAADPKPSYEIRRFIIPDELAHPEQNEWLKTPTSFLRINPAAIKELVDSGELWVGDHPWTVNADSKNGDNFTEYQKDFSWVNDPYVQRAFPLIVKIAQDNKNSPALLIAAPTSNP